MKQKHLILTAFAVIGVALGASAQMKVGDNPTSINANSVLEIESTNKGMLLPRVALTATDNIAPLTAHVAGMVVYNTATVGTGATGVVPGYYYNDGAQWVRLAAGGNGGNVSLPVTNLVSNNSPAGNTPGQLLYNTNPSIGLPVGPVYWNGSTWVPVASVTASNGLNVSGSDVRLGGTLSGPTGIDLGSNKLQFSGSGPLLKFGAENINSGIRLQGGDFAAGYGSMWISGAGGQQKLFISAKQSGGSATEDLTTAGISDIILNHDGGNVGIGTSGPQEKLDINGNAQLSQGSYLRFPHTNQTDGNDGKIGAGLFGSGLNILGVRTDLTRPREIRAYGNLYLPNDRLGIGTTEPIAPLQIETPGSDAQRTLLLLEPNTWATTPNQQASYLIRAGEGAKLGGLGAFSVRGDGQGFFGGNVGIGTTAPEQKLSIAGTGNVLGVDNAAGFAARNSAGVYEGFLTPRWSDDVMYLNYGGNGFNIRNNASASTMFMTNTGNVGIGTFAPTAKLDVNGALTVRGNSVTNAIDHVSALTLVSGLNSPDAGEIRFGDGTGWKMNFAQAANDGATKLMTLTDGGDLGIGTTTPMAKLDVNGRIKISGGAPGAGKVLTSDATGLATWENAVSGADGDAWGVTGEDQNSIIGRLGGVVVGTSDLTMGGLVTAKLAIDVNSGTQDATALGVTSANSRRLALNTNANGSFSMFDGLSNNWNLGITQSGGNVGIGTAAPTSKLDVGLNGGSYIRASGNDGDLAGGFGYSFYIRNNNHEFARITGEYGDSNAGGAGGISFSTLNYGDLSKRMFISQTGNVGIGTMSPGTLLEVASGTTPTVTLRNTSAVGGEGTAKISFNIASGVSKAEITAIDRTVGIGGAWNGALAFNTSDNGSSIERMRINEYGSVGIGTTTPGYKLDVNGIIKTNAHFVGWDQGQNQVANTSAPLIVATNGAGIYQDKGASNNIGGLSFYTHETISTPVNRMTITPSGAVGIGTATPAATLEVNGDGKFAGGVQIGLGVTNGLYGDGSNIALRTFTNGGIYFQNSGGTVTNMIISDALVDISKQVAIRAGAPGAGKVLTSDANGLATWETLNASRSSIGVITANYTATAADGTILCNVPGAGMTLTLPDAALNVGKILVIRKIDNDADVLTFSPAINYSTTQTIASLNYLKTLTVQSDGTAWWIINE